MRRRARTIGGMNYWSAKSDLIFIKHFRDNVLELYIHEDQATAELNRSGQLITSREWKKAVSAVAHRADPAGYQEVRRRVAVGMTRAVRLASELGVPTLFTSYPAPAVGGPVIPFQLFEAILSDPSHGQGVDAQLVIDALNRTVGAGEDKVQEQFRHLVNPAWLLWAALIFILRIPFIVLGAAGFNIEKFESELWAKLFKLAYAAALLYLAGRWGVRANVIP